MTLDLTQSLPFHVRATSGCPVGDSTPIEVQQGLSAAIVDQIADNWIATTERYAKGCQEYYFSVEFLMGRALLNNLSNLGFVRQACEALTAYGLDFGQILEEEPDAALGNGGLGRLAACFFDSCVTLGLPVHGYGILYRYGPFKQLFDNGFQTEHLDLWMGEGYPFAIRREGCVHIVSYADLTTRAVLYDIATTGCGAKNVGTLCLWKAEPIEEFDYDAFNSQCFADATVDRECTVDISRVLYPNDTTFEGKVLCVRQQYFFCSVSLQEIAANYVRHCGTDLNGFAELNAVQLSGTHPALAIPEFMCILMDEHGLGWEEAWKVVFKTFVYTNHTALVEALETWDIHIFDRLFPRIAEIARETGHRFRIGMAERGLDQATIDYIAPAAGSIVHIAWIVCYGSYSINGVAALHTEIIKRDTPKEWYAIWPERFNDKTDGVTPCRWLKQCNPRLVALLDEVIDSGAWVRDLTEFSRFTEAGTDEVFERLSETKHANKVDFVTRVKEREGVEIDPGAIFDAQIRRLHEYKCQLLDAFYVLDLYFRMKDNPTLDTPNRVFTLGVKAAPGYIHAKVITKLIDAIAELVNNDADTNGRIKVVFVHNYNVSPAEYIIPAADVSKQISMVSKEVSDAPNMKFMMNGVLTLGTLDGANVGILKAVGDENAYIFGVTDDELPELRRHYGPRWHYENVLGLKRVIDALTNGTLDDSSSGWFHDIRHSILEGGYDSANVYYVLDDFASYHEIKDRMAADYRDQKAWNACVWTNISRSGRPSSDRMISDYAREVWHTEGEPIA